MNKFIQRLRKYIFIPVNIVFVVSVFMLKRFFIGFEHANTYLQQVSKPGIIPILKLHGATIGENCLIDTGITFHNAKKDYSNFIMGNNCHIGKNCFFDIRGKVTIEENVVIAMQVTVITHQDISKSELTILYPSVVDDVVIKRNVYVGVNSTILRGVTINHDSIVAAGSVVIKDVESNVVVTGVPAKFIKNVKG